MKGYSELDKSARTFLIFFPVILTVIAVFIINRILNGSSTPARQNTSYTNVLSSNTISYLKNGDLWEVSKGKNAIQYTHTGGNIVSYVINHSKNLFYYIYNSKTSGNDSIYYCSNNKSSCSASKLLTDDNEIIQNIYISPDYNNLLYTENINLTNGESQTTIKVFDLSKKKTTNVFTNPYMTNGSIITAGGWLSGNSFSLISSDPVANTTTYHLVTISQLPVDPSNILNNSNTYTEIGNISLNQGNILGYVPGMLLNTNFLYRYVNTSSNNYYIGLGSTSDIQSTDLADFTKYLNNHANMKISKDANYAFFLINSSPVVSICSNYTCNLQGINLTNNKVSPFATMKSVHSINISKDIKETFYDLSGSYDVVEIQMNNQSSKTSNGLMENYTYYIEDTNKNLLFLGFNDSYLNTIPTDNSSITNLEIAN